MRVTSSVTASFCALIAPTRWGMGAVVATAWAEASSRIAAHAAVATRATAGSSMTVGSSVFAYAQRRIRLSVTTAAATTTATRAAQTRQRSPAITPILTPSAATATLRWGGRVDDDRRIRLRLDLADGGLRSVPLHRGDAVLGRGLRLVGLADGDDLAVAGLEPEPPLAGLVLVQLELPSHGVHLQRAGNPEHPHSMAG